MSRKINKPVFAFQQPTYALIPLFHGCSTLFVPNLFPVCSRFVRLHPCSETVFDGHTCNSLRFLPVSRGSRGSGGGGRRRPLPQKICRVCSSWSEKH